MAAVVQVNVLSRSDSCCYHHKVTELENPGVDRFCGYQLSVLDGRRVHAGEIARSGLRRSLEDGQRSAHEDP